MTEQMAELVLQDADTSKGLKSLRAFKFSKEERQRFVEEAKESKYLKDEIHHIPTSGDCLILVRWQTIKFQKRKTTIPFDVVGFDKEKIRPFEEDWTTLLGVAAPALGPPSLPEIEAFERERQAFLRIKDSLLDDPEFRGRFVAIYEGNIVGQDEDNRELAKRVYSRYGYVPIYIGKIERERRVIEMPSPEGV